MIRETITTKAYGAYQMDTEINVHVTEIIETEQKSIQYDAHCKCIVPNDNYNQHYKYILVNAMREYCECAIQQKKIDNIL